MEIQKVHEIRQSQLRKLLEVMSIKDLGLKADIAQSSISRMLMPMGSSGAKNIGEKVARKIEFGAGKPHGWMDSEHFVGTVPAQVATLTQALEVLAAALQLADELTLLQARALLQHMAEHPLQAKLIVPRIEALLCGERVSTKTE